MVTQQTRLRHLRPGVGFYGHRHTHTRPGLDVVLAGTIPRTVESAKALCEAGSVPKPYEAQAVHNHIRRLLAARKAAQKPAD